MGPPKMSKLKTFIYALSVLSGTIIGVGFFSLPYITSRVGIGIMLGYFLVLGVLVVLIHLCFGELCLKTPDFKRLPGFAKLYLGNWGEKIAVISAIFGGLGIILAYLIVGSEFLKELLSPVFGGNIFVYALFYFVAGAVLIYGGISAIAKVEFWGIILFFAILFIVFFESLSRIKLSNFAIASDFKQFFLPYGPILFSLWGIPLVPEAEETLGKNKRLFKILIPVAILIPVLIYFLFIFLILGITGSQTTESALAGLGNFLSPTLVSLTLLFGILTTFTSFIALGLTLRNVFNYDLKMSKGTSWLITCFVPLILFLAGIKSFIPIISFVGACLLGIDGILILLMYQKIKTGMRRILTYPLILALLGGIIYEIAYFAR